MYCNSLYDFINVKIKEAQGVEYQDHKETIRKILYDRKNYKKDAYQEEWNNICAENEELYKSIEKEYYNNVGYSLSYFDGRYSAIKIGFCNNNFFILDDNSDGYSGETEIIIFDSKEEFLKYIKLDKLEKFIVQH